MKNREEVLKESREKNQVPVGFTTHEVADILGVSFTTIITWIKKGEIECYRTLGGHRRILPSEVEKISKKLSGNKKSVTPVSITTSKAKTKLVNKSMDNPAKLKTPVKTSSKPKVPIKISKKPVTRPVNKATISKKNVSASKPINPTNKI